MIKVVVYGWIEGFQKVNFTNFLRGEFGYSLSQAKEITDALLDNRQVELSIPNSENERIVRRLTEVGAKFKKEETDHSQTNEPLN
jgi:ribosomal protein L7/L12